METSMIGVCVTTKLMVRMRTIPLLQEQNGNIDQSVRCIMSRKCVYAKLLILPHAAERI